MHCLDRKEVTGCSWDGVVADRIEKAWVVREATARVVGGVGREQARSL